MNASDHAVVMRTALDSRVCLVCGKSCLNEFIVASVDDGRPPGTPYRWREVGVVHEHCESEFERRQSRKAKHGGI